MLFFLKLSKTIDKRASITYNKVMASLKHKKITLQPNATQIYSGINIVDCGFQAPDHTHEEGPLYKTENVLQYMVGGEGVYEIAGKSYPLTEGALFLLPKNVQLSYRANKENPYTYWWLGFDGEFVDKLIKQTGFSPENPILYPSDKRLATLFQNIFSCLKKNTNVSLTRAMGYFYELFALLLSLKEENNQKMPTAKPEYIKKAIHYITHNYAQPITIASIANKLGLNRMYFCTLFKKETGVSPYQYLAKVRLEKARKMLMTTDATVTEISMQCGFNSINTFSDSFKASTGWSPQQYRKAKREVNKPTTKKKE